MLPFIVLIPLTIAVLPLLLLALLYEALISPFKMHRIAIIGKEVQRVWIPNHKYLYIHYKLESQLVGFIEQKLLKQYGTYIIADGISFASQDNGPSENDTRTISMYGNSVMHDLLRDTEADTEVALVCVDPQTHRLDKDSALLVYPNFRDNDGTFFIKGEKCTLEVVQIKLIEIIKECINAWNPRS